MKIYILTKEERLQSISKDQVIPAIAFAYCQDIQMVLVIHKNGTPDMYLAGDVCYINLSTNKCADIEDATPAGQSFDISNTEIDTILNGEMTLEDILKTKH